jgi:hypothetical protein
LEPPVLVDRAGHAAHGEYNEECVAVSRPQPKKDLTHLPWLSLLLSLLVLLLLLLLLLARSGQHGPREL